MSAELYVAGAEAAEELLAEVFRVDVSKALNPLDPGDFLRIVFRLQKALMGLTGPAEAAAMAAALDHLDVDYSTMNAAKTEAVMRAANKALAATPAKILPALNAVFTKTFTDIASGTMAKSKETFSLDITSALSLEDKRVAKQAAKAQAHYVRDEYGKRADVASKKAREIVANGLKNGLGRVEIGGELEAAMVSLNANRSRAYYNMVSSVYAGRSRQYASLRSYDEAGIDIYTFEAVLDEVTSAQCRFMHGRTFKVKADLGRYKAVAAAKDPEQVRFIQPWVNVGKDANGDEVLYLKKPDGTREELATITDDARGELDETGTFATKHTDASLQKLGCTCPPLHGNCRSTIVPG